jgi:hypothetical protein
MASFPASLAGGKYQIGILLDQPETNICNGCECEGRVMWQLLRAQHNVKPLSSIHQLCNNFHKVVLPPFEHSFDNHHIEGSTVSTSERNEYTILDDWVQDGGLAIAHMTHLGEYSSEDEDPFYTLVFPDQFFTTPEAPTTIGQTPANYFPDSTRISGIFPEINSVDTLRGYPFNTQIAAAREIIEGNGGEVLYSYNVSGAEVVSVFYVPKGAGGYIFYSFHYYNGLQDIEGWRDFLWKVTQIQDLPVAADSTSSGLCPVGTVQSFLQFPDLASNIFQDIEPTGTVCQPDDFVIGGIL